MTPLTYQQAVALYHQGLDPTVAMLLALGQETARLRADNEELNVTLNAARAVPPSAPSGSIPPLCQAQHRPRPQAAPARPQTWDLGTLLTTVSNTGPA